MRFFKIVYDYNGCEDCIFLHFDQNELPFSRYEVYDGKHLPVSRLYCTIKHGNLGDCDYLANNLAYLVVSEKVKKILEEYKLCGIQFVEVYEKGTEVLLGYLVNCTELFDAFDEEKAMCQRFPGSLRPLIIIRFAINEEKTKGCDFLQLDVEISPYFVTEPLKKRLKKEKCIGFDFERVLSPEK